MVDMKDLVELSDVELIDTSTIIELHPTGLLFAEGDGVDYDCWAAIGLRLQGAAGSVHWWLGDWLQYGSERYGETYAQAIAETPFTYKHLANCKWVANRIDISRRRENLSWGHHAEVAGLTDQQQDDLLDDSIAHKWSVHRLREEVRTVKALADPNRMVPIPAVAPDPPRQPFDVGAYDEGDDDRYIEEHAEPSPRGVTPQEVEEAAWSILDRLMFSLEEIADIPRDFDPESVARAIGDDQQLLEIFSRATNAVDAWAGQVLVAYREQRGVNAIDVDFASVPG
jgi:hypothetical protein